MKLKLTLTSKAAAVLMQMYESGELADIGVTHIVQTDDAESVEELSKARAESPGEDILSKYAPHTQHFGKVISYFSDVGMLVITLEKQISGYYPATPPGRKEVHFITPEGDKLEIDEIVLCQIKGFVGARDGYYSFDIEKIYKIPPLPQGGLMRH